MTKLTFTITENIAPELDKPVHSGAFSRDWADEEELDELQDRLDAGRISPKQALLRARKLVVDGPDCLENHNFLANRFWDLAMRDEATDVWAKAYRQASVLIPKGFKGQINWSEIDNRSFLRVAKGYLLGLMHQRDAKAARVLAKKLLAWCPGDNLGVRMLMGDISMMLGDSKVALKTFLKEAADSPAHWYQAGQIAFKDGDFVCACTYIRRGIAANPYIAEGLTGRTILNEHFYWHASSRNGPQWASDYLNAPACHWSPQEIDFVDWVFNSAAVLSERAVLMAQHEGLTYEQDPVRRQSFGLRSGYLMNQVSDELSKTMVRKISNRFGVEIWPWDRAGKLTLTSHRPNVPEYPHVDEERATRLNVQPVQRIKSRKGSG